MANRIQLRRDTAANWTRENPILSQGEPGFDLTENKMKVGDGITAWTDLAYASGGSSSGLGYTGSGGTGSLGYTGSGGTGSLGYTGSSGSVGDFIITNTELSAAAGAVSEINKEVTDISWNSGDNTYVVTYTTNPGYGYRTKVKFGGTNISEIEGSGQTFYLNPYNYPTNTQWAVFSDFACTIKVDGSGFSTFDSAPPAYTTELIPGAKISIKTGTPSNNVDPGAIEFKIGGKTYGWTIDKDNHLRLPADGGASKIKNYYGHDALFANEAITVTTITVSTVTNGSNNLTLRTFSSTPIGVANWNGGGGWNRGYSNLTTTGGSGTGLTVDVATGSGGYISINEITITNPGYGYTNGDVITINNENNIPGTFTISVSNPTWTFGTDGRTKIPHGSNNPSTARGAEGDKAGMILVSGAYLFYCYADWVDGSTPIWQKVAMDNTDWD
jgi:hypothetical protein